MIMFPPPKCFASISDPGWFISTTVTEYMYWMIRSHINFLINWPVWDCDLVEKQLIRCWERYPWKLELILDFKNLMMLFRQRRKEFSGKMLGYVSFWLRSHEKRKSSLSMKSCEIGPTHTQVSRITWFVKKGKVLWIDDHDR